MTEIAKDGNEIPDKEDKGVETQEQTTSKGEYRETVTGYLKSINADEEITDDNYTSVLEKTMAEHVMPRMKAYDEANTNLKAMIHGDAKLGKVLADMSRGASFAEAFPRHYDVNDFTLTEGDPDYTKWEAANAERKKSYQSNLDRETQLENNRIKSEDVIASWFEEKALGDDEKKTFAQFVAEALDRAYAGEITPDFLNKMYYAMRYEDDVAEAEQIGELKGKNAKIVKTTMEEDKQLEGDNLPVIDGGGAAEEELAKDDITDALTASLRKLGERKPVVPGNY